jgi:hypothetical protein
MASGFIILKDGRCLVRRWTTYDYIIELVIENLRNEGKDKPLKEWLRTLIPEEDDEYNGYGGFIKKSTGEEVQRWLDLREMTKENQALFWLALQRAVTTLIAISDNEANQENIALLKLMLKMKHLADIGDNPDNLSDWRPGDVEPPTGRQIGPGW